VNCQRVFVPEKYLLAGPIDDVMKQGAGARTGGLQTSTLAVGLADAALSFLEQETLLRRDLTNPAAALRSEWTQTRDDLLALAEGENICTTESLRARANSLALRAAQASLAAAKGAGYVVGHPAGRWCREALFFLVWSCPQPVMAANLCELAGIEI
jgi:alkylation response protein AidB-like acyl-CoA dehydrogenase